MVTTYSMLETNILEALARFKFLSFGQMLKLGIGTSRNNLSRVTTGLKDKKRMLIGQIQFGFHPKLGRLEDMFYLRSKGKKLLVRHLKRRSEDIVLPKGTSLFYKDYFHRKATVDARIAVEVDAQKHGLEVACYDMYFDRVASNKKTGKVNAKAKTKIDVRNGYLIADSIFMITKTIAEKEEKALYCLEQVNGFDVKRVAEQLKRHVEALAL